MKYESLIKKMTLEEKASLMSGKDFWTTADIERLGIPSMFLADGPHGIRKQAVASDHLGLNESLPATCFPTSATIANSWNPELGEEIGKYLGKEAVAQRVNVLLGPGTNIKRNPLSGRNFEYFSEDPYLSGVMASSYIKGIQSKGISACVKHFAANNQEYRRMVIDTIVDERTLREIYLVPFEMAVKMGKTKTLMSSYNLINGEYSNENTHIMSDILRKEWGYKGVVVTDWGGGNNRVSGLIAGNELEMPTTDGETDLEIIEAVRNGKLDEKILDEAVNRLLTLIFETNEAFKEDNQPIDVESHHEMALKAAEESIVLLRNDNALLPLKSSDKIAIIGDFAHRPRYQGAGSSIVNPTKLDDTISLINEYNINYLGFAQGYKRYSNKVSKKLVKQAITLANKADIILLYIGLDEFSEIEGLDRSHMKIPQNQIHLLNELKKTGKKIVVILSCGSPVEMNWVEEVDAIVHSYLSGQAGAKAVLNVLTGKVNPAGKLSETYPLVYEDVPSSRYFPGQEVTVEYREGLYIGYRYFDTINLPVRYPFGYGLSYTTFAYSNLQVTDKEVRFDLKNTGNYDGAEVAQLYIGKKDSQIFRPKKELKGFKKVFLKVGEQKTISIPFDEYSFRYFNPVTNKWEVEGGKYEIYIAASCIDVKLTGTIDVEGTTEVIPYNKEELPSYFSGKVTDVSLDEFERLVGRKVPNPHFEFYKRKRMVITHNTTIAQLRYSKRWVGRLFSGSILFAYKFLKFIGKRKSANTLMMGMYHQPMRGLSRMSGGIISWGQLNGLIMMFNGKFFKGLCHFFKEGRKKRKRKKLAKRGISE